MSGLPANRVTCSACRGRGEYVAVSTNVGGGAYNDTWDVCHACNGLGHVEAPKTVTLNLTDAQANAVARAVEIYAARALNEYLSSPDKFTSEEWTLAHESLLAWYGPTAAHELVTHWTRKHHTERKWTQPGKPVPELELEAIR